LIIAIIQSLKKIFPRILFDVACNTYNKDIFDNCSSINKTHVIPERFLGNKFLIFLSRELRKIRAHNYDLSISGSGGFSSQNSLISLVIKSKSKSGIISPHGSIWDMVYNIPIREQELSPPGTHQIIRLSEIFSIALGIDRFEVLPPVLDIKTSKQKPSKKVSVALFPEASRSISQWDIAKWEDLTKEIQDHGLTCKWVLKSTITRDEGAIVTSNTKSLLEEINKYDVVICSEGGISHIAPALKKFTIILSGSQIATNWKPWSPLALLIEKPGKINSIEPRDVFQHVKIYLQNQPKTHLD